jgi:hypothetical protein
MRLSPAQKRMWHRVFATWGIPEWTVNDHDLRILERMVAAGKISRWKDEKGYRHYRPLATAKAVNY